MTVIVEVNKYAARRYHVNPSRSVGRVRNPVHIWGHTTTGAPNREVVPVFVEFEVAVPHLGPAGW